MPLLPQTHTPIPSPDYHRDHNITLYHMWHKPKSCNHTPRTMRSMYNQSTLNPTPDDNVVATASPSHTTLSSPLPNYHNPNPTIPTIPTYTTSCPTHHTRTTTTPPSPQSHPITSFTRKLHYLSPLFTIALTTTTAVFQSITIYPITTYKPYTHILPYSSLTNPHYYRYLPQCPPQTINHIQTSTPQTSTVRTYGPKYHTYSPSTPTVPSALHLRQSLLSH